jgi:hypothetical protein
LRTVSLQALRLRGRRPFEGHKNQNQDDTLFRHPPRPLADANDTTAKDASDRPQAAGSLRETSADGDQGLATSGDRIE